IGPVAGDFGVAVSDRWRGRGVNKTGPVNDLIHRALDVAQQGGAGYVDVRVVERQTESLTVKNGALQEAGANLSSGFGVRALVDGAWGFSGSARLQPDEGEGVAPEAGAIARGRGPAPRE